MNPVKILVVDDEIELERLIKQRFRKKIRAKQLEFVFADNGKQALEKIKSEDSISLVLTDINMPEMDGLTLLEKLREIDDTLKAVVVSAYGDMKNIRTAMNRGACDFVTKPIDFQDLGLTIEKTLEDVKKMRDNINQLQEAQAKLVQSEKMSALGQLVAGVAHEINNPVGFIAGNIAHAEEAIADMIEHIKLYQKHYPDPVAEISENAAAIDLDYVMEDLPQLIDSMKYGSDRIKNISTSLRTFSRSDTDAKVPFNIHEGIDSTLMILKYRLKANEHRPAIEVIKDYGELPPVLCYPGQLNQVFMNLFSNAIDALDLTKSNEEEKSGLTENKIIIKTRFISDKSAKDNSCYFPRVAISIKDNGPGIPPAVQERMFDHLFTTKSVGKGTGLGLSISRQIVTERHQGKIQCISHPGEGAEFIVEIPGQNTE
jgi:signal transduction histidine kinase